MDFPELHERLMREQGRAKGITFTYTYTGPDAVKPINCKISQMAHEHLFAFFGLLLFVVLCSQVAQHFYSRYYIRKEVLKLIRMHSQYGGVTSLTRGIPTNIIFNLLCERLARGGSFSRFFFRNRLTVERVDEACHDLLWDPEAGVHAYRLNEANHWWAEGDLPPSGNGQEERPDVSPLCSNYTGPTVGPTGNPEKRTSTTNNFASSPHKHSDNGVPQMHEGGICPVQCWHHEYSTLPGCLRASSTPYAASDSIIFSTTGQAVSNEHGNATAGHIKAARGLDDYSGLMREFRELQRASHTLSGELARERHLRSPYR